MKSPRVAVREGGCPNVVVSLSRLAFGSCAGSRQNSKCSAANAGARVWGCFYDDGGILRVSSTIGWGAIMNES